ncbi:hypothetical protein SUGI_0866380 [Cryptomeria japonica]|nr:hypothetical protein SUGI_0866380 [Cryptomeria japonica]
MLNLSYNQLEGSLPRKISHNFTVVDLKENKLYGSLPPLDFVSFMLDLSDNKFNGSIPATIGAKDFLPLSGNNLTGKIPSSICTDSNELGILDLSNNKLTGMIPASIGLCSGLIVLKLAQNVLQGEIPEELGNLQTLSTLNLNGNRLEDSSMVFLYMESGYVSKYEDEITVWIKGRALTYGRIYNADKFMDLSGCKENQTEWNNTANNDANVMDKWWAVGMGLSYGIGFATIIAVLCFHIEWRDVCFNWMDNFIYHLCEH